MTQGQLAEYLGWSENSIHLSRIENGKWKITKTIAKLMQSLDGSEKS